MAANTRSSAKVFVVALISLTSNVAYFVAAASILVQPYTWTNGQRWLESWVLSRHWDAGVTWHALHTLHTLSQNKEMLIMTTTAASSLQIFNCVLLIIGALNNKPFLMMPWLIQDALMLSLLTLLLVSWAFISFFIHVLLAFVSPLLAGVLLGLHVYSWHIVWHSFLVLARSNGDKKDKFEFSDNKMFDPDKKFNKSLNFSNKSLSHDNKMDKDNKLEREKFECELRLAINKRFCTLNYVYSPHYTSTV